MVASYGDLYLTFRITIAPKSGKCSIRFVLLISHSYSNKGSMYLHTHILLFKFNMQCSISIVYSIFLFSYTQFRHVSDLQFCLKRYWQGGVCKILFGTWFGGAPHSCVRHFDDSQHLIAHPD